MIISRRQVIELIGCCAASGSINLAALAQPNPRPVRLPLEDFVGDGELLKALRRGVREMKKRKFSDPLGWNYQAAIHGVTPEAVTKAEGDDQGVKRVFKKRYWNQCPHDGENSANFLPWHRGYTYHFEKILRMHTELDRFALPYWNYTDLKRPENRYFPKEFGSEHLDGNIENDADENKNPLYHPDRDFYFCGYEHPFAKGLPLLALTESAVDVSLPMGTDVFFGDTESEGLGGGILDEDPRTRGLLESYPHDHIHRAVGGIIGDNAGAMATPPTAGFDPIFPVHHSNIDFLWTTWSCMPGKKWSSSPSSFPSAYWFNERPWFFFDTDGKVVNLPRKAYFDHRALGIRFKGEDEACKPLALPDVEKMMIAAVASRVQRLERVTEHEVAFSAIPAPRATVIPLPTATLEKLRAPANVVRAAVAANSVRERIILRLANERLGAVLGTGFDVHLTDNPNGQLRRTDPSFVGSIAMFRHSDPPEHKDGTSTAGSHHGSNEGGDSSFDVSRAIAAAKSVQLEGLSVVVVPYPLLGVPGQSTTILNNRETLKVSGIQFLKMEMR